VVIYRDRRRRGCKDTAEGSGDDDDNTNDECASSLRDEEAGDGPGMEGIMSDELEAAKMEELVIAGRERAMDLLFFLQAWVAEQSCACNEADLEPGECLHCQSQLLIAQITGKDVTF